MTQSKFTKMLRRIEKQLKGAASKAAKKEVRKMFREETKFYYVGRYTVEPHLRKVPVKRATQKGKPNLRLVA